MDDLQKFFQRNLRRIAAVGAIFISLIAISTLLNSSPHTSAWMVKNPIPASAKITLNSVQLIEVNLSADSNHFVGSKDQVVGRFASRALQPGDLLTVNDLLAQPGVVRRVQSLGVDVFGDEIQIAQHVVVEDRDVAAGLIGHAHVVAVLHQFAKEPTGGDHVVVRMRTDNEQSAGCRRPRGHGVERGAPY